MYSDNDGHALLLFAEFDDDANLQTALSDSRMQGLEANLITRLSRSNGPGTPVWQLQLLVTSTNSFDEAERSYWRQQFAECLTKTLFHWRAH